MRSISYALAALAAGSVATGALAAGPPKGDFNSRGNVLISDQFNNRVIEVNPSKVIVASYGTINSPGFGASTASEMNAPYSAYVIGDYTGITPP